MPNNRFLRILKKSHTTRDHLEQNGPLTVREACDLLGVCDATARRHLNALVNMQIAETEFDGHHARIYSIRKISVHDGRTAKEKANLP